MASLEERVVARLREEKVKLWLAPYDDDGALTATANTYAAALDEADVAAVAATLRDLRRRAVEKLAAKRRRTVRGAGAAGEPFEVALDGGTAAPTRAPCSRRPAATTAASASSPAAARSSTARRSRRRAGRRTPSGRAGRCARS